MGKSGVRGMAGNVASHADRTGDVCDDAVHLVDDAAWVKLVYAVAARSCWGRWRSCGGRTLRNARLTAAIVDQMPAYNR